MSAAIRWFQGIVTGIWEAFLRFATAVLQWLADFVSLILGWLVDTFMYLLTFAASLLVTVPSLPTTGTIPALIATANWFVPLDVAFVCLGVVGLFWVGNYTYKIGKFIRGGG